MNTTKIGSDFEDKVYNYVESLLDMEAFMGVTKKYSKIFKHKKYKCVGTDRKIDFDITIETYNSEKKDGEWSSLIVLECKKYSQKVDIADLDEFTTKMKKISESGIKGVMITTKGYSRTGIEQARKDHIALAVFSDLEMDWLVTRNTQMQSEYFMETLLGQTLPGCNPLLYDEGTFTNIIDFFKESGVAISEKNIVFIPFYKDDTIKQKANELYKKCTFETNDIVGEILAKLYPDVRIRFEELRSGILGAFSFDERVITLSNTIINDEHRRNFTMAHEIGHLCLHEPYLRNHARKFVDYNMDKIKLLQDDILKTMEQQANKFASFLLIPQERLVIEVKKLFVSMNNRTGRFYLDNQVCNINEVQRALKSLSQTFNVSKEAMKIRLIKEGLLIDEYKGPQRMIHILGKYWDK